MIIWGVLAVLLSSAGCNPADVLTAGEDMVCTGNVCHTGARVGNAC